ncbi:hypothetical protein PFISCL1PPCAC_4596, partial [Pristionchus fissidentatus]
MMLLFYHEYVIYRLATVNYRSIFWLCASHLVAVTGKVVGGVRVVLHYGDRVQRKRRAGLPLLVEDFDRLDVLEQRLIREHKETDVSGLELLSVRDGALEADLVVLAAGRIRHLDEEVGAGGEHVGGRGAHDDREGARIVEGLRGGGGSGCGLGRVG